MKEDILVLVKTYPTLTLKLREAVCTAGINKSGKWFRVYPIPFRELNANLRFHKYDWINIELKKNHSDPRPESYKPVNYSKLIVNRHLDTDKGLWTKRKKVFCRNIHTDLDKLISEAKDERISTSLATFKPKEILNLEITKVKQISHEKLENMRRRALQMDLFSDVDNPFEIAQKVPFDFSFEFLDNKGKKHKLNPGLGNISIILELSKIF